MTQERRRLFNQLSFCRGDNDIGCMTTFGAAVHFELHLLSCFKRTIAIHLDDGIVGEDIVTTIARTDETKSLGIVEPLNSTRFHTSTSLE